MRYIYVILAFLMYIVASFRLGAQIVNIPDVNFKDRLINFQVADLDGDGSPDGDVDTNNDGEIQETEAQAVFGLKVDWSNIQSMQGIEAFINIKKLNCQFNQISTLDLSANTLLEDILCDSNDLQTLIINNSPNLDYLSCLSNQLTELDVSQNTQLTWLGIGSNPLASIDVSQNTLLENLQVGGSNLTQLDVTQNPLLKYLNVNSCFLNSIDISQNVSLELLDIIDNNLTNLDLSFNIQITGLYVGNNNLTQLDISQHSQLTNLICYNNNLNYLNVNNGNNENFFVMNATGNPNLICIQVDDVDYSNAQECINDAQGWCKDAMASYSSFCELGTEDLEEKNSSITPNPAESFVTIQSDQIIETIFLYNTQGQLIREIKRIEGQTISLDALEAGVYFFQLVTNHGIITKALIKK